LLIRSLANSVLILEIERHSLERISSTTAEKLREMGVEAEPPENLWPTL